MRGPAVCLLLIVFLLTACASQADRQAWLSDFDLMQQHMSEVYANLEWSVEERGIDLPRLRDETVAKLEGARTQRGARGAIKKFVEQFDDSHFRVENGKTFGGSETSSSGGISLELSADDALDAMGFRGRNLDFRVGFEDLDGFERVMPGGANPFAWGILTLGGGRRVGLVRIAHFGEDGYPDIARKMWPEFAAGREGLCDGWCRWQFWISVSNGLLRHLADGTRVLKERGIDALLIDITRNGGGTDWAGVAPRIFAAPLTECPDMGFVRHAHHADPLEERLGQLDEMLAELSLDETATQMLKRARERVAVMLAQARTPCDRRGLFEDASHELPCSQLVRTGVCGMLDYLPPGSLEGVEGRSSVYAPLRFEYEEGVWTGPLYVLMDDGTASASEQFVSLLEANDAATLLGVRTHGAGCGYVGGGIPLYLEHLDLTVRMPDCVRYRADGRNELEGIEPHVEIEWGGGDGERARRVVRVLAEAIE